MDPSRGDHLADPMPGDAREPAIVITHGFLDGNYAKTTHGLLRGPSRYPLVAVVDRAFAGRDVGEVCGLPNVRLPIVAAAGDAMALPGGPPSVAIVGVATEGGVMPKAVREELLRCAALGMTLVNGLHQLLADDADVVAAVERGGGDVVDIRRPPAVRNLRFWTGEARSLTVPRVAVLGTDCAVGKRTTAQLLRAELQRRGVRTEMIFTGQTGWLQGAKHGVILDATPNDFVSGELERALLSCVRSESPDLVLIEGQSSLRNPSGPCGAELLLGLGARGVVLQHAPGRRFFIGLEEAGATIPTVASEVALIEALGGEVHAVTVNGEGLDRSGLDRAIAELRASLGCPVLDPLRAIDELADVVIARTGTNA